MNDINNVENLSTSQIRDLVNQGGKFVIYTLLYLTGSRYF